MIQLIEIVEGDDRFFYMPIKVDGAQPSGGIDDWRFWMTGKTDPSVADAAADFQISTDNGGIIVSDSENCIARAHLLPEHTRGKAGQKIQVDVQTRDAAGNTATAARAVFKIVAEVTRA
jgi:hypothetical protein